MIAFSNTKLAKAMIDAADWLEANPDKHTTGAAARDANGAPIRAHLSDAVCFCAMGRVVHNLRATQFVTLIDRIDRALIAPVCADIIQANDMKAVEVSFAGKPSIMSGKNVAIGLLRRTGQELLA